MKKRIYLILLLLFVGNVASVVAIVGELSSSSNVDFSFVSDELDKYEINKKKIKKLIHLPAINCFIFIFHIHR